MAVTTTTLSVVFPNDGLARDVTVTGQKPYASQQFGGSGGFGGTLGLVSSDGTHARVQLSDQTASSVVANDHAGKAIIAAIIAAFNA